MYRGGISRPHFLLPHVGLSTDQGGESAWGPAAAGDAESLCLIGRHYESNWHAMPQLRQLGDNWRRFVRLASAAWPPLAGWARPRNRQGHRHAPAILHDETGVRFPRRRPTAAEAASRHVSPFNCFRSRSRLARRSACSSSNQQQELGMGSLPCAGIKSGDVDRHRNRRVNLADYREINRRAVADALDLLRRRKPG
jgi:hypothetical protein